MNPLDVLLGPLATVECRRAVRPRRPIWVRMAAALPAAGVAVVTLWLWMLWGRIDAGYVPGALLAGGMLAVEVIQVVLALLLSPALIAGAIAGEKDRGTLGMLLTSRLTAGDIVLGRLVGSFSQVALLAVAGLPPLLFFAALRRASVLEVLFLIGLPAAVAIGSAGLTIAASTMARRGRDALLTIYLLEVLLLMAAFFGASSGRFAWLVWLAPLNPFAALDPQVSFGAIAPAAVCVALWLGLGLVGTVIAIWQLRPAYHRHTGGESRGGGAKRRRVPSIGDRPMLWKELYIDSAGTFGAFGRWISRLLIALAVGGGLVVLWGLFWRYVLGDARWAPLCDAVAAAIAFLAIWMLWLVQWGIGLRAAGLVATERQRFTWDAILASPLDGHEIVVAKTWGSLYALRWLIAATLLAWTAAALGGAFSIGSYLNHLALLAAGGGFMAVAGLGVSLTSTNTTRGMAMTIGVWMAAAVGTAVLAFLLAVVAVIAGLVAWATYMVATAAPEGLSGGSGNLMSSMGHPAYSALRLTLYLAITGIGVLWIATQFDRLAGRMGSLNLSQWAIRSFKSLSEAVPQEGAEDSTVIVSGTKD